jgi:hypothetical protein
MISVACAEAVSQVGDTEGSKCAKSYAAPR